MFKKNVCTRAKFSRDRLSYWEFVQIILVLEILRLVRLFNNHCGSRYYCYQGTRVAGIPCGSGCGAGEYRNTQSTYLFCITIMFVLQTQVVQADILVLIDCAEFSTITSWCSTTSTSPTSYLTTFSWSILP